MNPLLQRRLWTQRLERLLMALALLFLGICSWAWLDTSFYEMTQGRRLDGILRRKSIASPRLSEGWVAATTRREVAASGLIGRLEIPRLGVQAIVAEGADSLTLHRAVGHVPRTAFPGEPGNVVLAGHRDSFFRNLAEVRSGDHVTVDTPDGIFEYSVVSKSVVQPEQTEVLAITNAPTLTLITCYPFHYLGPAPERFVVRARQVTQPRESSPEGSPDESIRTVVPAKR